MAATEIFDPTIAIPTRIGAWVDVDLLRHNVTTSNTQARLLPEIGQRQVGDLLYNVANLLNPDTATTLLLLLTEL